MNNIPTNSRIIVVLEPHPEAARLCRAAKRRAEREKIDWEVLIVETPNMKRRSSTQSQEILSTTAALAEQMGGKVKKIHAKTMMEGIIEHVNQCQKDGIKIYSIKVGDIRKNNNFLFRKPLWKKLSKHFDKKIKISIVHLGINLPAQKFLSEWFHFRTQDLLFAVVIVISCVAFIELIKYIMPEAFNAQHRNKTMVLLIACAVSSLRHGFVAGLITSTLSFLVLSFFYYSPTYSLRIENSTEALTLLLFLSGGVIISIFGNKSYGNMVQLAKNSNRFSTLLSVHRLVLNKNTKSEAIATLNEELKKILNTDVVFLLPEDNNQQILGLSVLETQKFNISENRALDTCWMENKSTGVGTPYNPEGCNWRFEPLNTAQKEVGILCILINDNIDLDEDFGRLLSGIADQTALILERIEVERMMEDTKLQAEREKLRSMLLSSVSHDLKTPLASVIGSLSVYRSMGKRLPEQHRVTLIDTALDEAQRLDSFITNILDMTRIESGQVEMREEWTNPAILVDEVVVRLRNRLRNHSVNIYPSVQELEVMMDSLMTGQVIQNLLDNAAKYTKEGTNIDISWDIEEEKFVLRIRDHGNGIPNDKLEKVFDKYARINKQDSQVAGTGLGLAISRAVIKAQGGTIRAFNHNDGGAIFELLLPKIRIVEQRQEAI